MPPVPPRPDGRSCHTRSVTVTLNFANSPAKPNVTHAHVFRRPSALTTPLITFILSPAAQSSYYSHLCPSPLSARHWSPPRGLFEVIRSSAPKLRPLL